MFMFVQFPRLSQSYQQGHNKDSVLVLQAACVWLAMVETIHLIVQEEGDGVVTEILLNPVGSHMNTSLLL